MIIYRVYAIDTNTEQVIAELGYFEGGADAAMTAANYLLQMSDNSSIVRTQTITVKTKSSNLIDLYPQ